MKTWKTIAKIVAALIVVAGIVYVVAAYGERIVRWARKMMNRCLEFFGRSYTCCFDSDCEDCADDSIVANAGDFEG